MIGEHRKQNEGIAASGRKRKSKPEADEKEESEFGSSSDNDNDDIRVHALPQFSPIPARGGENKDNSGDCDGVAMMFEGVQFCISNRKLW